MYEVREVIDPGTALQLKQLYGLDISSGKERVERLRKEIPTMTFKTEKTLHDLIVGDKLEPLAWAAVALSFLVLLGQILRYFLQS